MHLDSPSISKYVVQRSSAPVEADPDLFEIVVKIFSSTPVQTLCRNWPRIYAQHPDAVMASATRNDETQFSPSIRYFACAVARVRLSTLCAHTLRRALRSHGVSRNPKHQIQQEENTRNRVKITQNTKFNTRRTPYGIDEKAAQHHQRRKRTRLPKP